MTEWTFATARALRKALRAKKVSALELARDAIAQIVGPWLEDRTTLKLAELIEQAFGGFVQPDLNKL